MGKLRINGNRLWDRLDELAQVGAIPGTLGSSRLALTKEDGQARDLVVSWMRQLEMEVSIDQIGNVIGLWHGKGTDRNLPPVTILIQSAQEGDLMAIWESSLV